MPAEVVRALGEHARSLKNDWICPLPPPPDGPTSINDLFVDFVRPIIYCTLYVHGVGRGALLPYLPPHLGASAPINKRVHVCPYAQVRGSQVLMGGGH